MYSKEFIENHKYSTEEIPKRITLDSVIIAENGSLKTIATYYVGHLSLDNFANWGGEHLIGFTGPETRIVTRELRTSRILETEKAPNEIPTKISANTTLQEGVPMLVG